MVRNRSRTTLPKGRQLKQEAFQKQCLDEWIEANVEQNKLLSQLTFWKQLLKGTCVSNTAKGLTFSPTKVRKSPDDNLMSLIQCFLLADLRWTTVYPSVFYHRVSCTRGRRSAGFYPCCPEAKFGIRP